MKQAVLIVLLQQFCLVVFSSTAIAATYTVTNTNDSGAGSLRQAILDVNSSLIANDNTIAFEPGVFNTSQTITLTSGELAISNSGTLTINGTGANLLTISGNVQSRIFRIDTGSKAIINGLTVTNGNTTETGGGIYNRGTLILNNSVIINNIAFSDGGGISNILGTVTINNSTISNNSTTTTSDFRGGGGVGNIVGILTINNSTISNNFAVSGWGGGIYSAGFGSKLIMTNSSISNNTSKGGGGIYHGSGGLSVITNSSISNNTGNGNGGGINNNVESTLNLINTTISSNSATGDGGFGGGIYNVYVVNLTNVTIANNSAVFTGGGVNSALFSNSVRVNARNTIIADNTAQAVPDFIGILNSQGYNLIEAVAGTTTIIGDTTGNIIGQDPQLLPFANYGGATKTHALKPTSPAIDKGRSFGVIKDQRGLARPVDLESYPNAAGGDATDIGAFELQQTMTATSVLISGRVVTANGRGIRNVQVRLIDESGQVRTVVTSPFGYYRFADVPVSHTYTINASAKKYIFNQSTQMFLLVGEMNNVDFVADN